MDKDFRSLEHKIRDLMIETMARNSAKRMQIANVGRPTDVDDKSKLAKQAEIKTKVIDEENIDEAEKDPDKHFSAQSKPMQDAINLHLRKGKSYWEAHRAAKVHVKEEIEQVDEAGLPSSMLGKYSGTPREKTVTFRGTISQTNKKLKDYKARGYEFHKHTEDNGKHNYTMKHPDVKEEALDEISKGLATRYKDKVMYMPVADQDKESPHKKIKRMIGAARAISKVRGSDNVKVNATEEVIDEAQTKQQRAAKAALATQSGEYAGGKKGGAINRMALMKPKDLKKLSEEEVDPPVTTDKKKDKNKSDMNDMDANKIKGGKTEVNFEPRTDDRPENATLEDSKSKKASKDENKKIGAKSGVKEETMSNTPFGLPQGLINAVSEALKGGQKKLDKNHNGKLDGQDFKMLRKEEAVVEDEQIDEVSKKTLSNYIRKASSDAANYAYHAGTGGAGRMRINRDEFHQKADKRLQGVSKAAQKLAKEEVEEIEELSKGTLGSYAKRAATQVKHKSSQVGYSIGIGQGHSDHAIETSRKSTQRAKGLSRAIDKLAKEEVESIDELSKKTVQSYYNKGRQQGIDVQDKMKAFGGDWTSDGSDTKTLKKRQAGHQMALRRRRGEVKMSEEAQFSEEEIARIEAIAKGL